MFLLFARSHIIHALAGWRAQLKRTRQGDGIERKCEREREREGGWGWGGGERREGQFLLAVKSTNPSNKVARGINGAAVR